MSLDIQKSVYIPCQLAGNIRTMMSMVFKVHTFDFEMKNINLKKIRKTD